MNEETNYSDETPENEHQQAEAAIETENTQHPTANSQLSSGMTIGELLRSKREERGLNLKTISQQTKIHMGLLEHLENNDLAKLPSKTYVRGFVKSAAKILNINQDEALDVLEATYNRDHRSVKKQAPNIEMRTEAAKNTLSAITATPLETVRSVTMSSSAFIAKAAVILLIVGVVGFNVKNLFDRNAEERLKLPKVLSTIHQKTKPAPKVVVPKAAPKTEAELAAAAKVNPIQVNIIQDKKDTPAKTEMTINDVNLKNISLGEKQFTEDNSLTGEKLDEIFPPKYRVKPVKGQENVFINAVDGDSWITYKVDDKDIKKYVLRQGRSVFMRGEKIRLFIGNTKTLKIFYNNKLISLKGGTTKNLVFPEELKTKYMSPLFVFQKDGSVVTSDEYIKANQPATTPTPTATPSKVPATTPATPTVKHL